MPAVRFPEISLAAWTMTRLVICWSTDLWADGAERFKEPYRTGRDEAVSPSRISCAAVCHARHTQAGFCNCERRPRVTREGEVVESADEMLLCVRRG